ASWPVASRTRPDAKNAKTSEAAGTATVSQRGRVSRRSIPTRIVPSGHQQPDLLDVRPGPRRLAGDPALVDDRDPVGESEDLVEVLAQQQHAHAVRRRLVQVRVDALDRADVQAARGRSGDEHLRLPRELAGKHDLLQVAAREEANRRLRAGRRDPVATDQLERALADPPQTQQW